MANSRNGPKGKGGTGEREGRGEEEGGRKERSEEHTFELQSL